MCMRYGYGVLSVPRSSIISFNMGKLISLPLRKTHTFILSHTRSFSLPLWPSLSLSPSYDTFTYANILYSALKWFFFHCNHFPSLRLLRCFLSIVVRSTFFSVLIHFFLSVSLVHFVACLLALRYLFVIFQMNFHHFECHTSFLRTSNIFITLHSIPNSNAGTIVSECVSECVEWDRYTENRWQKAGMKEIERQKRSYFCWFDYIEITFQNWIVLITQVQEPCFNINLIWHVTCQMAENWVLTIDKRCIFIPLFLSPSLSLTFSSYSRPCLFSSRNVL